MAVLGMSVALTACGGAPEPKSLDETAPRKSSESSTPAPSASPSAKTEPDKRAKPGKVEVAEGTLDPQVEKDVKAFVRRFMDASDRAATTGEFTAVQAMISADCSTCKKSIDYYVQLYRDGGKSVGGEFVDPKMRAVGRADGTVLVFVDSKISAGQVVRPDGKSEKYPAEQVNYTYTVQQDAAGEWRVTSRGY
jgi:hypothetical protein